MTRVSASSALSTAPISHPPAAEETTRPRTPSGRQTARLSGQIAVACLAVIALVASTVSLALAGRARAWLGFRFTGVPATLAEAGRIFAHNTGAMLGLFGLLLIAQVAARRPDGPARTQWWLRTAGELLVTGVIAANLLVVGAALGAYGARMAEATLPHGPVELAAFALAGALYLEGRQRPLSVRQIASASAAAAGLLATAAGLEALVTV